MSIRDNLNQSPPLIPFLCVIKDCIPAGCGSRESRQLHVQQMK
jgi:hypothetical protein